MVEDKNTERALEVAREAAGAVAGTLIGGAVGGVPGAVLGAALGPAASATLSILERSVRARFARASETLVNAASMAGIAVEDLEAALTEREDRLNLAADALDAAATSTLREKLDAYAAVLASAAGANLDAEIDSLQMVVRALAAIERPHVKVLDVISKAAGGIGPDGIAYEIQTPAESLRSIVRMLELHGLITDRGGLIDGGVVVEWHITEIGELAIDMLTSRRKDH